MNPLTLVKRIQNINAKEASLGISDQASWHAKYKDSAYVFVGGIPFDLTEGDLLAVFAQYGEIVDVNLVRDKGTGKSKGFAFVAYEDQRSTNLAVDNLNGAQILGRIIRVDHVSNYKKKEEEDEETEQKKREERGVCRSFQRGECNRGAACKFSHDEKLGGLNSMLSAEVSQTIPVVSKVPTMILAMGVTLAFSSLSDLPSVAAVVGSRQWPMISRYRASICTQPPKTETIHSLFRQVSDKEDTGIIRELLMDFHASSGKRKPEQIIIFRQGLSESQFKHVICEMEEIIKACKFLDETWSPKFTLIVAQRRHHTKLFQANSSDNIPPGTVVDTKICHPLYNNNFYMCAHAARVGTSRPIHYFVLLDEMGFSSDNVQELVHCLCYVSQRCTSAIYEVAPLRYARLASAQMLEIMKTEGPQLPKLHKNVRDTMFFC